MQGIGAALLTPQTLSTITRIFPPERRGVALSVWGATAGVATLVGPLAGGVLVDGLGWQWIFIVNVPIGVIGLGLALVFVPALPTEKHRFRRARRRAVRRRHVPHRLRAAGGPVPRLGAVDLGPARRRASPRWSAFVYWQSVNPHEPLIPLKIFRDNDFSLSNVGIAVIGFAVTAMILPVMFYAQAVCGLSPTRSALLTAPMAIATGVLAPFVGKLVDRAHPRPIVGFGFSALAIALTWLSIEMTPTTPIWRLLLPFVADGHRHGVHLVAAGRHRHPQPSAAAGRRRFGRLQHHAAGRRRAGQRGHGGVHDVADQRGDAGRTRTRASGRAPSPSCPSFLHEPFSTALSQSLLLPAFVALFGVVAALFLRGFGGGAAQPRAAERPDDRAAGTSNRTTSPTTTTTSSTPSSGRPVTTTTGTDRCRTGPAHGARRCTRVTCAPDESVTDPLAAHVEHPLPAPAETWHGGAVETWQSLMTTSRWRSAADRRRPISTTTRHGARADRGRRAQVPPSRFPRATDTPRGAACSTNCSTAPVAAARSKASRTTAFTSTATSAPAAPPQPPPPARGTPGDAGDGDGPTATRGTYGRHSMRFRD